MAVANVRRGLEGMEDKTFVDDIIGIDELDTDLYMAPKSWKAWRGRGTFGGQVVAQALMAASETVKRGLNLHSMHCYFLRPGDVTRSTIYRVSRTRDGNSFCSRTVSAIQQGEHILTLQASFHDEDSEPPSILEYQPVMPTVKHHSELLTTDEYLAKLLASQDLSESTKAMRVLSNSLPIQSKPVDPLQYTRQVASDTHTHLSWIRVRGELSDEVNLHRSAAAFISDGMLLWSAISSIPRIKPKMIASLDHSMWFHGPFKTNEWLLYETVSTQMFNGRALCQGRLWTEDGHLAVTIMQEGIIRGKL